MTQIIVPPKPRFFPALPSIRQRLKQALVTESRWAMAAQNLLVINEALRWKFKIKTADIPEILKEYVEATKAKIAEEAGKAGLIDPSSPTPQVVTEESTPAVPSKEQPGAGEPISDA